MKSLLLGLALSMSAALPAQAVTWQYVIGDEQVTYYIDTDSIQTDGNSYIYNARVIDRYKTLIFKNRLVCSELTFTVLATARVENNRLVRQSVIPLNQQRTNPILIGSPPAILAETFCQ